MVYHGEERRRVERIPCKDVWLTYETAGGFVAKLIGRKKKSKKPLPVRNISRDGVCFLAKKRLKPGQVVHIRVNPGPRQPWIRADAQVIWLGEGEGRYDYRVGIGFSNVQKSEWQKLRRIKELVHIREETGGSWRLRAEETENRAAGSLDEEK
ncbi:MAG: PilZ domain-containing protein [Planctomycetes bacterium]|nr:PilZ domain-containing protein [Planctomycetota bacterium]